MSKQTMQHKQQRKELVKAVTNWVENTQLYLVVKVAKARFGNTVFIERKTGKFISVEKAWGIAWAWGIPEAYIEREDTMLGDYSYDWLYVVVGLVMLQCLGYLLG